MTKVIVENIKEISRYRDKIFIVLLAGIILSISSYVFLIEKAVMNVVGREDILKESRNLAVSVSSLEERYFSIKNNIDIGLAHSKGFKDSEVSFFISNKSAAAITYMVAKNEL